MKPMTFAEMWSALECAIQEKKAIAFAKVHQEGDTYQLSEPGRWISFGMMVDAIDGDAPPVIEYRKYEPGHRTRSGKPIAYITLNCSQAEFDSLWIEYEPVK